MQQWRRLEGVTLVWCRRRTPQRRISCAIQRNVRVPCSINRSRWCQGKPSAAIRLASSYTLAQNIWFMSSITDIMLVVKQPTCNTTNQWSSDHCKQLTTVEVSWQYCTWCGEKSKKNRQNFGQYKLQRELPLFWRCPNRIKYNVGRVEVIKSLHPKPAGSVQPFRYNTSVWQTDRQTDRDTGPTPSRMIQCICVAW